MNKQYSVEACARYAGPTICLRIDRAKEKLIEKALIPLPPTGFASVFCASQDVVQTNL